MKKKKQTDLQKVTPNKKLEGGPSITYTQVFEKDKG